MTNRLTNKQKCWGCDKLRLCYVEEPSKGLCKAECATITDTEDLFGSINDDEELTPSLMKTLLKKLIQSMKLNFSEKIDKVETELKNAKSEIIGLKKENDTYKQVLIEHQQILDSLEKDRRKNNVIISGVKDAKEDVKHKFDLVTNKMGLAGKFKSTFEIFRLGNYDSNNSYPRQILATLTSFDPGLLYKSWFKFIFC